MDNSGRDYDLQDTCWRWTFDDIHLEQRLEAVERTLFEKYAKMNEKDSVTTKGVDVDQEHNEEMVRYRVITRNVNTKSDVDWSDVFTTLLSSYGYDGRTRQGRLKIRTRSRLRWQNEAETPPQSRPDLERCPRSSPATQRDVT